MADNVPDDLNQLLIGMLETSKRHATNLFQLTIDVEGLKATLTGHDRDVFDAGREKARAEAAYGIDREVGALDEAIKRLRRM